MSASPTQITLTLLSAFYAIVQGLAVAGRTYYRYQANKIAVREKVESTTIAAKRTRSSLLIKRAESRNFGLVHR